jgi:glyoxylase-like metal-dependent hydrolase (beta-lactamase superfamily II)
MAAFGCQEGMMHVQRIAVHGTNCYLLQGQDGMVLLDPGPPGGAPAVVDGAREAGVQPGDIRLILVSHGHLDH